VGQVLMLKINRMHGSFFPVVQNSWSQKVTHDLKFKDVACHEQHQMPLINYIRWSSQVLHFSQFNPHSLTFEPANPCIFKFSVTHDSLIHLFISIWSHSCMGRHVWARIRIVGVSLSKTKVKGLKRKTNKTLWAM